MANEKLSVALEEARAKGSFLELSEDFLVKLIHSALHFDNSSIKEEEVRKVLVGNVVGISSDKVQNITNQKNAFNRMLTMVKNNEPLDETHLKDLHQLLAEGLPCSGGLYRNVNISVKGSNHTPCSHEKVYDRMEKYFAFLAEGPKANEWEYISYAHVQLAKIHPFLDCNGRLARLVLNYELLKANYMPVIITPDQADKYFNALESFKVEKEISPFMSFLEELEMISLNEIK